MRTGDLDQRIDFLQYRKTSRGDGSFDESWADYKMRVPADVRHVMGKDELKSGQVQNLFEIIFVIRNRPGITSAERIAYGGKQYNIVGIVPNCKRNRLEIKAKVVTE